jgi:3-hydroxy-3-methylglutaryl CoA synthase
VRGVLAYGSHLPHHRLRRATIADALGVPAGKGTRTVAGHDEDATSMGVEAARRARAAAPLPVDDLLFATTALPYLDKTNAATIHAALGLGPAGFAADVAGSPRSGVAALRSGLFGERPALVVLSDVRTGKPGSADEREAGDGAVAFVLGEASPDQVLAEYLGGASTSGEFLDRWRLPGDPWSTTWEERFGERAYAELFTPAVDEALKAAGITADEVDRAVLAGVSARAVGAARKACELRSDAVVVDDLAATVGNTGTAHAGLVFAAALDATQPGEIVLVAVLADGADALLFRVTEAVHEHRASPTVAAQVAAGDDGLSYTAFLTWRGLLDRDAGRRPDPTPPSGPVAWRHSDYKHGFVATRCDACGTRHLPPQRVCTNCDATDAMTAEPVADIAGTIATFTVDWLATSLAPPTVFAVVDFEGGGRCQCEVTDVDHEAVRVGDRVEMTFRRLHTSDGRHNYFWKARPVRPVRATPIAEGTAR